MATLTEKGLFYTETLSAPLRTAQVIGLASTAFLAGKTFANSFTAPALLLAPAPLLAKQWKTQFSCDKFLAPAVVTLSSTIFGYFAYRSPKSSSTSILYTTATALLLTTIPYSLLTLEPLYKKLEAKAQSLASASVIDASAEAGISKEETVHSLVDQWATFTLGRSVLSGLAALLATWAAVDRLEVVEAVVKITGGADRMGP